MTTSPPNQPPTDRHPTGDPRDDETDAPLVPFVADPAAPPDDLARLRRELAELRDTLERIESTLDGGERR